MMLTTIVGRPLSEVDTPALLIDLDAFEHNIAQMAADIAARGAAWRPHSKAHKSPAVAHKQIAAGAIGVTCAKLGEAEVYAASGIRDILIANQIVGPIKTRRYAALCRHADVMVAVDCVQNIREIDAAAAEAGSHPRIVIEVNTGMERAGSQPGEPTLALAREIAASKHLRFGGLMAWEGQAMAIKDVGERLREIHAANKLLTDTADLIRANGIPVDIVSAGGTGTYLTTAGIEGITEVEAGGGIFGDMWYIEMGANVRPAMMLMAQVTSRPNPGRVVIDAGRKTVDPSAYPPKIENIAINGNIRLSAEHGYMDLVQPSDSPRIAERVTLRIGYSDQCNHLHEAYYGVRNGIVECVWPTLARGRLQ